MFSNGQTHVFQIPQIILGKFRLNPGVWTVHLTYLGQDISLAAKCSGIQLVAAVCSRCLGLMSSHIEMCAIT
jgi:hypothetical protein